jgi:acetyl-CoA carboxylase biotin carboxyl carrier protein
MNIKEIQNLIKFVSKSGVEEVKIEREDFKITIKTKKNITKQVLVEDLSSKNIIATQPPVLSGQQEIVQETSSTNSSEELENENHIVVKSPIIGTFYRKPSPDKPSFVEVGKTISEGDVLCVIEAMKLFNEIESEFSGKIVKILAEDQSPVEFDQPLFIIDPS